MQIMSKLPSDDGRSAFGTCRPSSRSASGLKHIARAPTDKATAH